MIAKKMLLASIALVFGFFFGNCGEQIEDTGDSSSSSLSNDVGLSSSLSDTGAPSSSSDTETPPPLPSSSSSQISAGGSYLGMGYDVIKSSYINRSDVIRTFPILDQEKMANDKLIVSEPMPGKQEFLTFVGTSRKEFYQNRNETMKIGLSTSVPYASVLFSGKLGTEFSMSQSDSRIFTSKYLRGRSHRYTQDEYIKSPTVEKLAEYLTESFAADLNSKSAEQILDRYGTHVLIQYNKGGAMEFNYVYHGSELTSSSELSNALRASLSANLASFSLGVSSEYKGQEQSLQKKLESDYTFNSLVYGGMSIPALSLSQIESNYETWLNSIASNADICGIDNFNKSLIPIWELAAASGKQSLATELENKFKNRAAEQAKNLAGIIYESKEFNSAGSYTYTFDKGFPATIEVYALGAGGGGQGGHYKTTAIWESNFAGTGGAGGGGAAAYMKFDLTEQATINISVGSAGSGGSANDVPMTTFTWESGYQGGNGGDTKVTFTLSGISTTLTAAGGKGGGGSGQTLTGGSGGANSAKPEIVSAENWSTVAGSKGSNGIQDGNTTSIGGNSGGISRGSVSSFGGGTGSGSGGKGGYNGNGGAKGNDGKVVIVVTYSE